MAGLVLAISILGALCPHNRDRRVKPVKPGDDIIGCVGSGSCYLILTYFRKLWVPTSAA
jgi:hypothetical protein